MPRKFLCDEKFSFEKVLLEKFLRDEKGATVIEYGLIAALLALAIIAAVGMTGDGLVAMFSKLLGAFG